MANPKTYLRPTTLDEARQHAFQPDTIALAGGALTFGAFDLPYETVVDLQAVPELQRIDMHDSGITIGGAVRLQQLVEETGPPPAFKRSITRFLPINQRSGTSVAESLIAPRPLSEWLAVLMAHDIGVELFYPDGQRSWHSITDLIGSPAEPTLSSGIITAITIPWLSEREALGTAFVARTPADDPIVNAAAFVRLNDDRTVETAFLAVGGASVEPVQLIAGLDNADLHGKSLDDTTIKAAADAVANAVNPAADWRGSVEYRREMARVLTRRALEDCAAQLQT
jgi:carbon-monoxide dehydrogenase medium subunit